MSDSVATTPTPNDMPKAKAADNQADAVAEPVVETTPPDSDTASKGLSPDKLADLNRTLREERNEWKREARSARERQEALQRQWDELKTKLGVDDSASEFDPKTAFERLQAEVQAERTERTRVEVARTLKVDPVFVIGNSEEEMRESAERYLADVNSRIEEALQSRNVPAAPAASTVTANDKIGGPQQITSQEDLRSMSPGQRMEAFRNGQLDSLLGKSQT